VEERIVRGGGGIHLATKAGAGWGRGEGPEEEKERGAVRSARLKPEKYRS